MKFIQVPPFMVAASIVLTGIVFAEVMTRTVGSPWQNKAPMQREIKK